MTLQEKIFNHSLKGFVNALELLNHKLAAKLAYKLFTQPKRVPAPPVEQSLKTFGEKKTFNNGLVSYVFGEGSPVLLVHGWQGRGLQLGSFIKPLMTAGYQVIALDGPAHGQSPGKETHISQFANKLVEVGEELGHLRAIISHSFGGGASALAISRGLKSERLVIIGSPNRYKPVVDNFCRLMGLKAKTIEAFYRILEFKIGFKEEDLVVSRFLNSLEQPTLVVHDETDREVDIKEAKEIKNLEPRVELYITKGFGHRRILKAQAVVDKVVDFVQDTNKYWLSV